MTETSTRLYENAVSQSFCAMTATPADTVAAMRPMARRCSRFLVIARDAELPDWGDALAKETAGYKGCFKHVSPEKAALCTSGQWDAVIVDLRSRTLDAGEAEKLISLSPKRYIAILSEKTEEDAGSGLRILAASCPPVSNTENTEGENEEPSNMKRSLLQKEAVDTLMRYKRLIVNWGTGTGKSRVAVRASEILSRNGKDRILLLVGEDKHKANWRKEFRECLGTEKGDSLYDTLTVECYASLPKYAGTKWDLIVADEAHHLRSEKRTALVASMYADRFLCLSATMSEKGDAALLLRTLRNTFGEFRELTFSLQDSIDAGILHEPVIYVHVLPIEKVTERQSVIVEWGPKKMRKEMGCNASEAKLMIREREADKAVRLIVEGTASECYSVLCEMMDSIKKEISANEDRMLMAPDNRMLKSINQQNEFLRLQVRLYGNRRKHLLGTAKSRFAENLIRKVRGQNLKYICFCSDVAQGERLGATTVIHSLRNASANDRVIEEFNDGSNNSIYAVGMIKEGQNLKGIQAGVIVQLGGKERDFIQMFGRAMRAEAPVQHLVVFSGTRDEHYYETAVENISPAYLREIDYAGAVPLGGR